MALLFVSIHAPARGAILKGSEENGIAMFQFTHPRGVRWFDKSASVLPSSFNSRTREGCDVINVLESKAKDVSIHAPARGAINIVINESSNVQVSIHAPARGAIRYKMKW